MTRIYHVSPLLDSMPKTGGGNLDMTGDVVDMFDEFNDVPASNPFFFSGALGEHDVNVFPYFEPGVFGRAQGEDANGNGLYETGFVKMSTGVTWDSHDHARQVLCHEIDHLMGLDHVYAQDAAGIDVVGSKATCIGHWASAGPRIDDVSALDDVYSGVVP